MKATMKVMTINQRGIIFDLAHRVATELTYKPSIRNVKSLRARAKINSHFSLEQWSSSSLAVGCNALG